MVIFEFLKKGGRFWWKEKDPVIAVPTIDPPNTDVSGGLHDVTPCAFEFDHGVSITKSCPSSGEARELPPQQRQSPFFPSSLPWVC